ncbi:MAG: bacillithiol biosynthesis cysteine-adding enzyme BshC, partial [Bacteroidetes bacterium]|nr:bacillithiol biosynthesis cysteine-adding enzyme BshC [Bacteroidota bacterium]
MEAKYIDYDETRCFSSTVSKLLARDQNLAPFINQFPSLSTFEKIISERKFKGNRTKLVEVLQHQYQDIIHQPVALKSNIEALSKENTYTVTTGHQLNIFTGPLYFIFKIVTAINLAKELKNQFPDKNFVPVYWMATEDHDFEEINHTYIGDKKISWKLNATGATGRLNTKSIIQALNEYKGILGISKNAEKLSEMVAKAYADGKNLADATHYFANELFGEFGLVIIDADHPILKSQFTEI